MRLLASAIAVVVLFPLGAWVIALLIPQSSGWLKVALAMLWLFSLVFGIVVFGNRNGEGNYNKQGRLLVCGAVAAMLMAAFLVPVHISGSDVPRWAAEIVLLVIAIAVFMFFNHLPVHRTRPEVIAFLEKALESGGDSLWDEFVSVKIAEPQLEAVRLKCLEVNLNSGEAFDRLLRSLLDELRSQPEVAR